MHIDIKYHFIKNFISENKVSLEYVKTDENIADMFTKAVDTTSFNKFRRRMNMYKY